jgi:dTDP-4-dehydrorhamnose reductase
VIGALEEAPFAGPFGPVGWDRAAFDLDEPASFGRLLDTDRPETVVHCAAWTDVDDCAREPDVAMARNGVATGVLAAACAERGIDLLIVSTNEVFDGRRDDGRGFAPDDEPHPINAYGASKLAGEVASIEAYQRTSGMLGIVRTAWLYGPPGNDFPAKILAAAVRARTNARPLKLVADEVGSPTYAPDLADAIVELIAEAAIAGIHHVVNAGRASRAAWGRELLAQAARRAPRSGFDVETEDVPASTWPRASTPPAWAVLEPTPLPGGEPLRPWELAVADYLPTLLRQHAATATA